MTGLTGVIAGLAWLNGNLLRIGRGIGVVAVGIMVSVTLVQVFFRYVLNDALPWPDEAARFCMLWMTGLMAPTVLRRGGFVAIDMFPVMLPGRVAQVLSLILFFLSLLVLVAAAQIGFREVTGIGGRFASASLYLPTSTGFDSWYRVPRSWMMASLLVGIWLLILVNVELILRSIARLIRQDVELPEIPDSETVTAE